MTTWVVSDTHFFHSKLLKSQRSDFIDVSHMDTFIVEKWNSVVKEDDLVYHLGDFAFGDVHDVLVAEYIKTIYNNLNGRKRLIIGNHETPSKIKFYVKNDMFEQILPVLYINDLVLSHHPVHPVTFKDEHLFNIHGHMHLYDIEDSRYANVNFDRSREIYDLDKLHFELIYRNRNRLDKRYALENFEKKVDQGETSQRTS